MPRVPLVSLVLMAACGGDVVIDVPPECNPLGGGECLAPWPASTYLQAELDSPGGVVLAFPPGAIPANQSGVAFDPSHVNGRSGYSPATQIVAHFGVPLDASELAGHADIGKSVTDASPTLIIDAADRSLVPHFAELDANTPPDQLDAQALYLRPAVRLLGNHRYIVAIKKTLRAADGSDVPVPPGFAALVSGKTSDNARLEALRPGYGPLFDKLAALGIDRRDLLVAWEFVTEEDSLLRSDLVDAREAALAAMGPDGVNLTIGDVVVEADPRPGVAARITFTFDSPNVRDDNGILRGSDGRPEVRGTSRARGVALVPSCATAASPAPITVFGHGFFGGIEETGGAYLQNFAARTCRIVIGTDWRGMSREDQPLAILAMGDLNQAFPLGERAAQGMVDVLTLIRLATGKLSTQVLVDGNGATVARLYGITFFGISQGHILGSTLFAIDPVTERAVLHVGGAAWSVMFERSVNWAVLGLPFKGAYPSPLRQALMQQVLQMALDVIEPLHWAPLAAGPGTSNKQYLVYASIGDAQVTNLATFLQARTMALPLVTPSVVTPYGLSQTTGVPRSGLVIVDEHAMPLPPESNLLNDQNNQAHENPRRRERIIEQIDEFLSTGTITNTCNGPCDCAAGACGDLVPD